MERNEAKTEVVFIHQLPGGGRHAYIVSADRWDMSLNEVMDDLIKPLLLAAGFHPGNIEEYFNGED